MAMNLEIVISATDKASGVLRNVGGAIGGLAGMAGKFALGGAVAGIARLVGGLGLAISEAASAEEAIAGLDAVLKSTGAAAQEQADAYAKAASQNITTTRLSAAALQELQNTLQETQLKYDTTAAKIQEQKERIRQSTEAYGEQGLVVLKQKAQLAEMENELSQLGGAMEKLNAQIARGGEVIKTNLADKLGLLPPVARMTRDELLNLASELQNVTRFSDEATIGAEKILLTFTQVGKEVFPDAIRLGQDLSTVFGVDLEGAMKMLGKALNDPVQGMTALRRVGVSFTDAQEEQVKALMKSGKLLEAQKLILAELKVEVGGASEAVGKTFAGRIDILRNKFSDLLEVVGGAVLPSLTEGLGKLIEFISRPEVVSAIEKFAKDFAAGLGFVASFMQAQILPIVQNVFNWLTSTGIPLAQTFVTGLLESLQPLGAWLMGEGIPMLQGFIGQLLDAFNRIQTLDIGGIFANLFSGAGGAAGAGGFFGGIVAGLQENFGQLANWAENTLAPVLSSSFQKISEAAMPTLQQLGDWIKSTLLPALQEFGDFIGPRLQSSFAELGNLIMNQILPALTTVAVWIFKEGLPALGALAAIIRSALNDALATMNTVWGNIVSNFNRMTGFIKSVQENLILLQQAIEGAVGKALEWFNDSILVPLRDTFSNLLGIVESLVEWVKKLADALANMQIPDFLQRHSPSPLEIALSNSVLYLRQMHDMLPLDFGAFGGFEGNLSQRNSGMRSGWVFNAPVTFVVPNRATQDSLMGDARLRSRAARTS